VKYSNYDIYSGTLTQTARLKFSVLTSRGVEKEEWHPAQIGKFHDAGHYIMEVPYADPAELIMDILRLGHQVEVLPPSLRLEIQKEALLIIENYK
jgi:predicted DNA-binding transcriptional regulator YafY